MSDYNIGNLANIYLVDYAHHLQSVGNTMQQFGTSVADKVLYNPLTMYINDLYQKALNLSGGEIHPDGKKMIGIAIGILLSVGIGYFLFKIPSGHSAGDNSLHSTDVKKHGQKTRR